MERLKELYIEDLPKNVRDEVSDVIWNILVRFNLSMTAWNIIRGNQIKKEYEVIEGFIRNADKTKLINWAESRPVIKTTSNNISSLLELARK